MENPCHTNPYSVLTKTTVTCPDHDTIVAAFEHASPAQCTTDERAAMDYFLNYVLPCFDNNLAKKWLHGTTTHQLLFGENYVYNALQHVPKQAHLYRLCHCAQLYCLTVGSPIGSACPIQCKNPDDGTPYGKDETGACACPICKCKYNIAFTHNAAQIVRTKQLLDKHSVQMQQDININKSQSALPFLMNDAGNSVVQCALEVASLIPRKHYNNWP
jgi:hypothetical protein